MSSVKLFSDMSCGGSQEHWVWTFSVFLSHIYSTAGASLLRCSEAGDRGRMSCIISAAEITWFCLQHNTSSTNEYKLCWHLRQCHLRVWHRFLIQGYLFCFFHLCICCVIDRIQRGISCCVHTSTSADFILGGRKSAETLETVTRTFAFTHTRPIENCMCLIQSKCL